MAHPLTDLLFASGPHPDFEEELNLFGQFTGDWDMVVKFFNDSGDCTYEGLGLWSFGWILDGRAIQDVLVYDPPDQYQAPPGMRRIGTSLRSFHPETRSWRVTWISATSGIYLSLIARARGKEIGSAR